MRQFTSEVLDKPWFYDREMWPHYLTMLADAALQSFPPRVRPRLRRPAAGRRLLSPVPLSVPARRARATTCAPPTCRDAERDRNLETLRFISEQTVARGIEFQLGIWMHGYQLANSPRARHIDRGPHRRKPRRVLPRRADRGAARLPGDLVRGAAHSRRERHRRRQLRLLADGVRRRRALRPQGRDRPARQGHRPDDDRSRAGHRHAGQRVAEVLGRASRHAVSPGGHSRAGDAGGRAYRQRA